MMFSNNTIFCLLFFLFFGWCNLTAQNLTVCSLEFPDTVTIGQTATLKGYVLNKDTLVYTDDITVNIDIEDTAPDGILNDGEVNDSITINQTGLAPNDSVYFERELLINLQEFGAVGVDLVVAWPQVAENDGIIVDEADIQLTYVQEEEAEANDNNDTYDFLPASIINYIDENYPNALIDHICMLQSKFKIELDNEVELIFSLDGVLQNIEEDKHYNNYEDDDDDNYGHSDEDDKDKGYLYDEDENDHDDDKNYSDDDDDDGKADDDDEDKGYSDDDDDDGKDEDEDNGYSDDDDEGGKADDDDEDKNYSDDDDEDKEYSDDDDDGKEYGDKGGKTDEDDLFGDDSLNREKEISPFKISVNKQAIQVTADDDFKITAVELYHVNGSLYQRLFNKSGSSGVKMSIHNSNQRIGVLQIYVKDDKGTIKEFSQKIILGSY